MTTLVQPLYHALGHANGGLRRDGARLAKESRKASQSMLAALAVSGAGLGGFRCPLRSLILDAWRARAAVHCAHARAVTSVRWYEHYKATLAFCTFRATSTPRRHCREKTRAPRVAAPKFSQGVATRGSDEKRRGGGCRGDLPGRPYGMPFDGVCFDEHVRRIPPC